MGSPENITAYSWGARWPPAIVHRPQNSKNCGFPRKLTALWVRPVGRRQNISVGHKSPLDTSPSYQRPPGQKTPFSADRTTSNTTSVKKFLRSATSLSSLLGAGHRRTMGSKFVELSATIARNFWIQLFSFGIHLLPPRSPTTWHRRGCQKVRGWARPPKLKFSRANNSATVALRRSICFMVMGIWVLYPCVHFGWGHPPNFGDGGKKTKNEGLFHS